MGGDLPGPGFDTGVGSLAPEAGFWISILCVLELSVFAIGNRAVFSWDEYRIKRDVFRRLAAEGDGPGRWLNLTGIDAAPYGKDIWGFNTMIPLRVFEFVSYLKGWTAARIIQETRLSGEMPDGFRLMDLRYFLEGGKNGLKVFPTHFRETPRVFLSSNWRVEGKEGVLKGIADPAFDPQKLSLLEEEPGVFPSPGAPVGKLGWEEGQDGSVEIQAENSQPQLLVVMEDFMPGWTVTASVGDGKGSYKVIPVDQVYLGVPLRPGFHHFRLHFEPPGLSVGSVVSVLSLAIFLIFGVYFLFNGRFFALGLRL